MVAFTPKGGCPLKHAETERYNDAFTQVAFTPKGGCPLKPLGIYQELQEDAMGSIHPQGWVPIETFSSKSPHATACVLVAFTPKGGCPLKLGSKHTANAVVCHCSIHPQGWVPIETRYSDLQRRCRFTL